MVSINKSIKKVVVFAKAYPPVDGGIETYSQEIAKAYSKKGYGVTVITACPLPLGAIEQGKVKIINVGEASQLIVFLRMIFVWLKVKNSETVDIVHATTWRVLLPSIFFPHQGKFKKVVTVHGREVLYLSYFLKKLKNWVLSKSDFIVGVSETALLAAYKGRNIPTNALVSFNGINIPEVKPNISSVKLNILSFCRLVERKNISLCLIAISEIRDTYDYDFEYIIAGTGPELDNLKKLSKKLRLCEFVTFLGRVESEVIPTLYSKCNIFLHPQISLDNGKDIEGFGITIADAMAFSKPVIVGEAGGPKEFVQDNITGKIVDGNDLSSIKNALVSLMEYPEESYLMGCRGKEWVNNNLSWNTHISNVLLKMGINETT